MTYRKAYHGRMSAVIPHAKAVEIKAALKDRSNLTATQLKYIDNIKGVYLGSEKPKVAEPVEAKLFHEGIEQGVSQQIPVGDR